MNTLKVSRNVWTRHHARQTSFCGLLDRGRNHVNTLTTVLSFVGGRSLWPIRVLSWYWKKRVGSGKKQAGQHSIHQGSDTPRPLRTKWCIFCSLVHKDQDLRIKESVTRLDDHLEYRRPLLKETNVKEHLLKIEKYLLRRIVVSSVTSLLRITLNLKINKSITCKTIKTIHSNDHCWNPYFLLKHIRTPYIY